LKIERKIYKIENKYRRYIARDYSKFDVDKFAKLVENEIEEQS